MFCHPTVSFLYQEDPTPRQSRCTIAVEQIGDQSFQYAVAWTAPMDAFAKKRGRQLAEGRLMSDNCRREITTAAEGYREIFEAVFADAIQNGPSRWTIKKIEFIARSTEEPVQNI